MVHMHAAQNGPNLSLAAGCDEGGMNREQVQVKVMLSGWCTCVCVCVFVCVCVCSKYDV